MSGRSSSGSVSLTGSVSVSSSNRERLRPRSPHMHFYRDFPDDDDYDRSYHKHHAGVPDQPHHHQHHHPEHPEEEEAQDSGSHFDGDSEQRYSRPSTRAGTPSTTHSLEPPSGGMSSSSAAIPGHHQAPRRLRTGTNRLQAREDRPLASSRWGGSNAGHYHTYRPDFDDDLDDLSWTGTATSSQSEHTPQRKRRSTGLLAASPNLWQSDLRVWARMPDAHAQQVQDQPAAPSAAAAADYSSTGGTPEKKSSSGAAGGLAKKRLLAKRDSAQLLTSSSSYSSLSPVSVHSAQSGSSASSQAPSSLASSFSYGPTGPRSSSWAWRRAFTSLSASGLLVITTTDDRIPIHSIPTTLLSRTDIRLVDPSLFTASHIIAIRITATRPAKLDTPLRSPSSSNITRSSSTTAHIPFLSSFTRSSSASDTHAHLSSTSAHPPQSESIETSDWVYLCLGSRASQHALYALLKTFGQDGADAGAIAPYENAEVLRVSLQPPPTLASNGESSGASKSTDAGSPEAQSQRRNRTWRAIDLTVLEGRNVGDLKNRDNNKSGATVPSTSSSVDGYTQYPFSPTASTSGAHAQAQGTGTTRDFGTSSQGSAGGSGKGKGGSGEEPQHGTMATSGKFFVEVVLDDSVVAKTAPRKGSQAPFWRDAFSFQDLPPFEKDLQLRVYILIMRKGAKHIGFLGAATVPLQTIKRSESIESWVPIIGPPTGEDHPHHAGELLIQLKVTEAIVLPLTQYQPLINILADLNDHEILYDVVTNTNDLEASAELLLRISLEQRTLQARLKQMIELEIDGDESTANILFRGNTLLTKMMELYMRLIGTDFLIAALGDLVSALCKDDVDIEIDPTKLKSRHRPLNDNIVELNKWATKLWNALYEARHKCPNDLRIIFKHVQTIVDERYDNSVPTRRFTCISAFVFLRFFVPALLNPRLFGVTSHHPSPQTQRTLTLLAKALQGLANMSIFKNKEAFMSAMNPFVKENTEAFVDFIASIASPVEGFDGPVRSDWSSLEQDKYHLPIRQRNNMASGLGRDSIPTLPFLNDLPKDLSLLVGLTRRSAQQNRAKQTTLELQQQHQARFRSPQWPKLLDHCRQLHRLAQSLPRPAHLNGGLFLPQVMASEPYSPTDQVPHTALPTSTSAWRLGSLPPTASASTGGAAEDLTRAESLSVGGGSRFPFRLPSPRRNRAQTVSSAGARQANLRRQGSSEFRDVANAFSDLTVGEHSSIEPERVNSSRKDVRPHSTQPNSPQAGAVCFDRTVVESSSAVPRPATTSGAVGRGDGAGDSGSLLSEAGSLGKGRSSQSVHNQQTGEGAASHSNSSSSGSNSNNNNSGSNSKTGRLARMLNRS